MARLPDHLLGTTPPTKNADTRGSSRALPAPALTQTGPVQAQAAAGPSSQPGTAPQRARNSPNAHHSRNTSVASGGQGPSDLANIDLSQLHVESDSSDSDYRAPRHPGDSSGHSRSMSNPFPSLFSPKKKRRAYNGPPLGPSDVAPGGEGDLLPTQSRDNHREGSGFLPPPIDRGGRRPSFSTGPCITCGSLMRWACGEVAFRCGICLTVNDLVPTDKFLASVHDTASRQATASSLISTERTRCIVAECIRSYLEAVLQDVEVDTADQHIGSAGVIDTSSGRHSEPRPAAPGHETRVVAPEPNTPSNLIPPPSTHLIPPANFTGHQEPKHLRNQRNLYGWQSGLGTQASTLVKVTGRRLPSLPSTRTPDRNQKTRDGREAKRIFQPLEDYIISHIVSTDNLDNSFVTTMPPWQPPKVQTGISHPAKGSASSTEDSASFFSRGNFRDGLLKISDQSRSQSGGFHRRWDSEGKNKFSPGTSRATASRPIDIDWVAVDEWYNVVLNAAAPWESIYKELLDEGKCSPQPSFLLQEIESHILKGQQHAQRFLLKSIETVLKRPGRRIGEFGDFRFLIIALANPLLHASCKFFIGKFQFDGLNPNQGTSTSSYHNRGTGPAAGQHSVIIKRILGLISNASDEWHSQIIACFAQFSEIRFLQLKDLVGGFLAYRLVRYNDKKEQLNRTEVSDPLVPKVPDGASAASFHAALNQASGSTKRTKKLTEKKMSHGDDWQIKAAVRVLGLLFSANNSTGVHQGSSQLSGSFPNANKFGRARLRGQIVPTSDFYITLLDNCDLVSDFEGWEQQTAKFSFCQYPFLLSVWSKIQILEYEARRQMKSKARDAFFDSIMTRRNFDQHLILNIRRDCLVEDSLKGVSAAIGSGTDDIKKGLRIIFNGEEGIDAGGLRKEWFLLLVREVFNPDHGMFTYDEESQYCYFNPASFETSDQFFLVGVVLGLAIYNSTILDVALPPFAFRKLLLGAPTPSTGVIATSVRPSMNYTLADLAEYRPRLANGLQKLLDYEGDVETTFCLDFSITAEKFGHASTIPLCPGGECRPVTNKNREEYVSLYVRYLLDTAVSRQYEPFKRGFFTVCGCNALGLFRPEEIELLVRGSDEPLDVPSVRLAASYENWPSNDPLETEPTIRWFWEIFQEASPKDQRKLLIFITGSDRIPATGPASLSIRILCLGNDTGRFPTARTCFNILTLYRYSSKETMCTKLWGAVNGSEGFGLK